MRGEMITECTKAVMGYARKHATFTKGEVLGAVCRNETIKANTLGWVLFHLTQTNRLARVKRGVYSIPRKRMFKPEPTAKMTELADIMRRDFPYAEFCLYSGDCFSGLQHHLSINRLVYLAVPRFMVQSTAEHLRSLKLPAFANPDAKALDEYIDMEEENIVVLPLITQAPLQTVGGVPTPKLETLLVELHSARAFSYLRGTEYAHIFRNACRQYAIQEDSLLRYASRRHARQEIQQLLQSVKAHD